MQTVVGWGAVHGSFGYGYSFAVDPGKGAIRI
jgi:hypothetical protein